MARETLKQRVDDHEYEWTQYGARQSLKMLMRIGKIIGEPLAIAWASAEGQGSFLERSVNPVTLSQAVKVLISNAGETEVLDIIEQLTSRDCLCDGKKVEFNGHFEGRLDHMFRVLKAALEVQYGNFFAALQGLGGSVPESTPTTQAQ